jgi:signal transduction histidine kinase
MTARPLQGEIRRGSQPPFHRLQPSLQSLGTIARLDPGHPQQFVDAARAMTTTGSFIVLTQGGTGFSVTAAAGHGPGVGQVVSGDREQLARRALSAKGLVSGFVRDGADLRLSIAIAGAAGPGTVVSEESAISPTTPVPSTASSPFRSLDIALYLAARPDPSALVVTTSSHLPLAGVTVDQPVPVGADTWLIVARSSRPLVGTLPAAIPWIILALGLLAAGLMTAVVETLGRRRLYASALVEDRTALLRAAMAELEAAQAQLVRQERLAAVGELASSVGHELRNPLGVIMNVLYLLEAGAGANANEPIRRHLATAKREVSAATSIVSDLLDYATGRGPIAAALEVAELVAEVLSVAPAPDGVKVVDRCEPLVIDADRDQIRQVLLNLVTNAYDAMPGGGVLTVAAASRSGAALITVSDTGIGMDEETRDSVFTPFFTKKARGIGLGLAVTKRIVESHGGTITVESTPSAGSSFTLTLPGVAAMASVPA